MKLQNDRCKVNITVDEHYRLHSIEDQKYELVLNPNHYGANDMYIVFSIQIDLENERKQIALVGDFYSYDVNCAVLEDKILTVLQNDTIVQIDVEKETIVNFKEWDSFGSNLGIYKVEHGYLIHGEKEIMMLDHALKQKWSFSGKDIFVTSTDKKAIELAEDCIRLYDFEDRYYELDYEGNQINQ